MFQWMPFGFQPYGPEHSPASGGGGGFTPASLSPALWIEAGNQCFQSNAGTTAATANSNPVGFWTDLSGNGFHISSAADDSTRPLLQGVGTHSYVDFDGVDDILFRAATLGLYASGTGFSIFASVKANPVATTVLAGEGNSLSTSPRYDILRSYTTIATQNSEFIRDAAGSNASINSCITTGVYDNTDRVVGFTDDGGAATANLVGYLDGSANGSSSYTRTGHALTIDRFSVGGLRRTTSGLFFVSRVYGLVVVKSVLSGTDRANLVTYLGNLAGLTL